MGVPGGIYQSFPVVGLIPKLADRQAGHRAHALARAMLNTAVEDGLLRSNPCQVKGASARREGERPMVMPDELVAIAEQLDERFRLLPFLGAYCSLRIGELAGLRRRRIDLLHCELIIEEAAVELAGGRVVFGEPKTAAGRRKVAIPRALVPMIEDHLSRIVGPEPDALLFTSPEGHPLRRTKFLARWRKACVEAGVAAGLHFHDLRGSGATWAAQGGATVAELMARLGHTTATMAMRYQRATRERDHAIADRLSTLLNAAGTSAAQMAGP